MEVLKKNELIEINGGSDAPNVSHDPRVQAGHDLGYYIGKAIGSTIRQIKSIVDIF